MYQDNGLANAKPFFIGQILSYMQSITSYQTSKLLLSQS
ncbi:hypothetical protein I600_45 [Maribacter dokdonensis DSW-8]|nr:hypothetical protein I600_45 [Maribacter dokdonensis DSW-8]